MRQAHLRGRGPHLPPLDKLRQYDFEPGYVAFTMPVPKRLRVIVGETVVADTVNGVILHESDHIPVYYFPLRDIRTDLVTASGRLVVDPFKGEGRYYSLNLGDEVITDFMWRYAAPGRHGPDISDHASFDWEKARWFEEDEEIFVHPRDPFRRVDTLPSSRHVEIFLNGELIADSRAAVFLFETGLPTRYYLPLSDIKRDFFMPSDTKSRCPYKGVASYYHATVKGRHYPDIAWYYPDPVHESAKIKGLVSFANEFVDRILVDGVEQARPVTSFSHGSDRGAAHPLSTSP